MRFSLVPDDVPAPMSRANEQKPVPDRVESNAAFDIPNETGGRELDEPAVRLPPIKQRQK